MSHTTDLNNLRVLVTGGAGFVGAHLVARLLESGNEVSIADIEPSSARSPLHALGLVDRVNYCQVDVRNQCDLVARLGLGYDIVFHLAAQPISPISRRNPIETMSVNVGGTTSVTSFARCGGAAVVILVSSACAYGLPDPKDCPLLEDSPLRPGIYIYTRSKQEAERVVRRAGICAGIARFVNLFGPSDWHYSRIVPRVVNQLLIGAPLRLERSRGESTLDFLFVRDAVEGLIALAYHVMNKGSSENCPVYNFGASEPIKIRALAELISVVYDGQQREVFFPKIPQEAPMSKYLSSGRANRDLGWKACTSRVSALKETLYWYRDNVKVLQVLDETIQNGEENRKNKRPF